MRTTAYLTIVVPLEVRQLILKLRRKGIRFNASEVCARALAVETKRALQKNRKLTQA